MYTTFLLYQSSSKFSKFIQGKSPLLQQLASVSLLKEKSKMCPKLIELLSWNGPTVHVCCFILARASTKTFVSRVQKNSEKIFVNRKIRQQDHSLAEVSLYYIALLRFDLVQFGLVFFTQVISVGHYFSTYGSGSQIWVAKLSDSRHTFRYQIITNLHYFL